MGGADATHQLIAAPSPPKIFLATALLSCYVGRMRDPLGYRKRIGHFNEPGHVHELTFSCYQGRSLLNDDARRALLSRYIDRATHRLGFRLAAFVYMPEHVHLLVWPEDESATISSLLKAIKQPFSKQVKQSLIGERAPLLEELTIRERPGKMAFRFWQEGGGYDRNMTEPATVLAAIDYLHLNPVRRGLVDRAVDWRWSSCRFFLEPDWPGDPATPKLERLPGEFLDA
jgi:REP-associated tyrosine transposase